MNFVTIQRIWMQGKYPTPGILYLDSIPFCFSLELPWKDNQHNISCIPIGHYVCKRRKGVTLEHVKEPFETFEVKEVFGRSGILFHMGNSAGASEGCILLGNGLSGVADIYLSNSVDTLLRFVKSIEGDEFCLEVRCDPYFS